MDFNKGVSTPIALTIIIVLVVVSIGGIFTYQRYYISEQEFSVPAIENLENPEDGENKTDDLGFGDTRILNDQEFLDINATNLPYCGIARMTSCDGEKALEYNCIVDAMSTPYSENSFIGPVGFHYSDSGEDLFVYNLSRSANSPGFAISLKGVQLEKEMVGRVGEFTGKITPKDWSKDGSEDGSIIVEKYHWILPVYMTGIIRQETRGEGSKSAGTAFLFEVEEREEVYTFLVGSSPIYSELDQYIGKKISLTGYIYDNYIAEYVMPYPPGTYLGLFLGENGITIQHICDQ